MRIAYFSPLPPAPSGIAAYSATVLGALRAAADITLFVDDDLLPQLALDDLPPVRAISSFGGPLAERFHVCVYQMGANTRFHAAIYATLHRYPGITVLHDLNLASFFGDLYLMRGQVAEYTRLIAAAYGQPGLEAVRAAHRGATAYDVARYPLFEPVVQRSLGTIMHSAFAAAQVRRRCPGAAVAQTQLPVALNAAHLDAAAARRQLGYADSDQLVAAFGYAAPQKRLDPLLAAAARLRPDFPQLRLAIVGKVIDGYDLAAHIEARGLAEITRTTGYVDDAAMRAYLAATDIGVNLRYPTLGESSATLVELMAAGKPTLVSAVDAFAELPDAACVKIAVGAGEEAEITEIAAALHTQLTDVALRQHIGAQARRYAENHCTPTQIAQQYMQFIEAAVNESGQRTVRIV